MKVYHDFFSYKSGIYRHTDLSLEHRTGYHSVKIIGWGEEVTNNGLEKYWVRYLWKEKKSIARNFLQLQLEILPYDLRHLFKIPLGIE